MYPHHLKMIISNSNIHELSPNSVNKIANIHQSNPHYHHYTTKQQNQSQKSKNIFGQNNRKKNHSSSNSISSSSSNRNSSISNNNYTHRKKFVNNQNNNNNTIKNQNIHPQKSHIDYKTSTNIATSAPTVTYCTNTKPSVPNVNTKSNNNTSSNYLHISKHLNENLKDSFEAPMVMNSLTTTPSKSTNTIAQKTQSEIEIRAESNNIITSTTGESSINTVTPSKSAPVSPGSYSIDFLHSVRSQMTAGKNQPYTPTSSPPPSSSSSVRYSKYMNPAGTGRNVRSSYSMSQQDEINVAYIDSDFNNESSSSSARSIGIRGSVATNSLCYTSALSGGPRIFQFHPSNQVYQYNNYQPNHHHHWQHNNPASFQYGNNNTNNPGSNSNNINCNVNRNQNHNILLKNSSGSYSNSNISKKNFSTLNNKYGNHNVGNNISSDSNLSSSSLSNRNKNHQNYSNLTYVTTDTEKVDLNIQISRSPSPNPNAGSSVVHSPSDLVENISSLAESTVTLSEICTQSKINEINDSSKGVQQDLPTAVPSLNDYESDSSHSSYRTPIDNYPRINRHLIGSCYPTNYGNDIHHLVNYPTASCSDDELYKSPISYYGSHQNLAYFNVNPNCNTYNIYSPSSVGSLETALYLNDNPFLLLSNKRGHSSQRGCFRGRRHLYSTIRAMHSFENTPPDRFLTKAHLIEIRNTPDNLIIGSRWDQLSQDIWDKFITSQQTEETFRKKIHLWKYLYLMIKKDHPRYGLYLVGSTISGFGADTSDVDMCLVCRAATSPDPRNEAIAHLNFFKDFLTTLGMFEQFHLIEAKVPILRFRDSQHTLEVDLNFNNCVGIRNTHLLYCYSQLDWRLRPLVLITKLWAQYHNINNAKTMTISSYSLALMVIHFLQCAVSPPVLPCLHEMYPEKFQIILKSNDFGFVDMIEDIGPYESQNMQSIGELFLHFLEYYSNFDYSKFAISVRTGAVLPIEICRQAKSLKNDIHQWKELCIEEPFDLTNTARSVYDCETFERIKAVFITSWKVLQESLDLNLIFLPMMLETMPQFQVSVATSIS